MRFIKKQDGFLDRQTGLEWSLENYGPIDWESAMGNHPAGWRMPTIDEVVTLINFLKYSPATNLPGIIPSGYWSSTIYAPYPDYVWTVDFYGGYLGAFNKTPHWHIRYLRERKTYAV